MGLLEEDTVGRMAWNFVAGKIVINGDSVVDAPKLNHAIFGQVTGIKLRGFAEVDHLHLASFDQRADPRDDRLGPERG